MRKNFLEVGKIVGTHGVKGMVRIQPWCDNIDFLTQFKNFFIGDQQITITSLKPHGNIAIGQIKDVDTIEEAEMLRNKVLLIKREDAHLPNDRYFISELIGCSVFDADSDADLGLLTDVSQTGANDVWHITKDGKEYLVPAIEDVIVSVDIDNEKIVLRPIKGIFDDEN
ncbi:MAG: 16S rRNA processing protein RimM [Clostridia bacterium]|nr:16S rRNA processing protein RimM [Clostridia bacterium]